MSKIYRCRECLSVLDSQEVETRKLRGGKGWLYHSGPYSGYYPDFIEFWCPYLQRYQEKRDYNVEFYEALE